MKITLYLKNYLCRQENALTFWMISGVIPTCSLISIGSPPAPYKEHHFWMLEESMGEEDLSVNLVGMEKNNNLLTAAGWEAGTAWGATNPAWGLSVARAAKEKETMLEKHTLLYSHA